LKGRYCWNKRTEAALKQCVNYFEQAIEIDHDYMLAYCGLADAYALLGIAEYGALPPMEVMPKAKAAAVQALEIDNTLAEAQTTVAHVKAFFDWDFTGADKEFNRAIELNPNYPFSHHWYALYLSAMERHDEGHCRRETSPGARARSPSLSTKMSAPSFLLLCTEVRASDRTVQESA